MTRITVQKIVFSHLAVALLLATAPSPMRADIYCWKDHRRVAHYTNHIDDIPKRYRSKVKALYVEAKQPENTAGRSQSTPQPSQAQPQPQQTQPSQQPSQQQPQQPQLSPNGGTPPAPPAPPSP